MKKILFFTCFVIALISYDTTIESSEAQSGGGTITCPSGDRYACFTVDGITVRKGRGTVTTKIGVPNNIN